MTQLPITQANVPSHIVDFGVGQPGLDLLPLAELRQATAHRLAQDDPTLLNYGAEAGDGRFLTALAHFLSDGYGRAVAADTLCLSAGTSQALDLVCTTFTKPGDTIFVEAPTYFLALDIFADHHLNVVSLPIDADGLDLAALEAALGRHQPAFLYTIPTFHNPATVTLTAERRRQLLALSHQYGFLIIADEVYQLLHFQAPPPPPLATLPHAEQVISLGSFSKILAPGLRLGWFQTSPPLRRRLLQSGLVQSGGSLNHFTSALVLSLFELDLLTPYLARLRATYARRVTALDGALADQLPATARYKAPTGGFFFWIALAEGTDAATLLAAAADHNISFKPGHRFTSGPGLENYIRLSFAYYDEAQLLAGAARLGALLRTAPP